MLVNKIFLSYGEIFVFLHLISKEITEALYSFCEREPRKVHELQN